jgi:PAS domain S-box-containing protein
MVAEVKTNYRDIFENAVEGIFETTVDGRFIIANPAMARMLGFESPEELIRERTELSQQHYVEPACHEEFKQLLEAQGFVHGFEYQAHRKDGSRIWLSESVRARKDENGAPLYYQGSARDITDWKLAENSLREREERYRRLLAREQAVRHEAEIFRDANIALTQDLSLDTVLETLLDYLRKLVPYDSANVMLRGEGSKFVVSALRHYERFQSVETTRAIALDGNANPLLRRMCLTKQSVLVRDTDEDPEWERMRGAEHVRNWLGVPLVAAGKVIGLYSVDKAEPAFFQAEHARLAETLAARAATAILNAQLFQQSQHYVAELEERINERKRAEVALRESEERYRELFENAKDAIYVHDLSGTCASVNRAAEKLLGYTRAEILGRNFIDFLAPEHTRNVGEKPWAKLAEKGETTYEVEVIAKDGRRVPVEVSCRSICENGAPVGVQGMARDITERKRAQEALQMFSRRLIEAQEEERQRIARELHDQIGQVLTAVKINLHALQGVCETPEASPYIKDNITVIDEALRQVRDLSVDLRPPLLDDIGLVMALRWYFDRQAQRTGLRADVLINLPDQNERFSRELETACFRIAQEALTNVVRHAQAKRVLLHLTRGKSELILVVRDDGVGFDVTALRRRAPRAATLGLLGMQERAHAIGGTIEINSAESRGTEIRSSFPINAKR